jgi:hypothetical protein
VTDCWRAGGGEELAAAAGGVQARVVFALYYCSILLWHWKVRTSAPHLSFVTLDSHSGMKLEKSFIGISTMFSHIYWGHLAKIYTNFNYLVKRLLTFIGVS